MARQALDAAGATAIELHDRKAGGTAAEVTAWFIHIWRQVLIRSNFEARCAVRAVAVAADSPQLLDQTAAIFRGCRGHLANLLEQGGLTSHASARFAAVLIASCEGAVVPSRAEQRLEPFDLVAKHLTAQVEVLSGR
jgi:hypothetical protein